MRSCNTPEMGRFLEEQKLLKSDNAFYWRGKPEDSEREHEVGF